MPGRQLARGLAAGCLAAAAIGLVAPTAAAAESHSVEIPGTRGKSSFEHRGDLVRVSDTRRDGFGVRAYLRWGEQESAMVNNTRGASSTVSKSLDIPEGTTVRLTMCYTVDAVDQQCSNSHQGVA